MKLHEALVATFATVGQEMPDAAIAMMAKDLQVYPPQSIGVALSRCRKELRRITLSDILERIPGGHPGPDEAWSMVAKGMNDEGVTMVWTDEIRQAFGAAMNIPDDHVAARMAFKESYARLVAESREQQKPITWSASLGHDPHGRESVLLDAAEKGRLAADHVAKLLPYTDAPHPRIAALLESTTKTTDAISEGVMKILEHEPL